MASATASKRRTEKTWHANISAVVNGVAALRLTSVSPSGKTESFGYYVTAIPSAWGVACHLEKFAGEVEDGEPTDYNVNMDPTNREHGQHECPCRGQLRWDHRRPCKHIRCLLKLHAQGKLPRLPQPPAPLCEVCEQSPAAAGRECLACHDRAAYIEAQRYTLEDF
jgi:hypothetical protein